MTDIGDDGKSTGISMSGAGGLIVLAMYSSGSPGFSSIVPLSVSIVSGFFLRGGAGFGFGTVGSGGGLEPAPAVVDASVGVLRARGGFGLGSIPGLAASPTSADGDGFGFGVRFGLGELFERLGGAWLALARRLGNAFRIGRLLRSHRTQSERINEATV